MNHPSLDVSRLFRRAALALGLLSFAGAAMAEDAPINLSVKTGSSSVTYRIVHKLHKFEGTSKKVEGRVRILPGGQAQVGIRVPVESFDSGNVNRDAHMKESTEAARFPTVEVKAIADGFAVPSSFPATVSKTFKAQVTLHGVTNTVDVPVTIKFDAADKASATASFVLSVDAFKVERPSLMFVKIDDEMKIDANLQFAP